MNRKILKLYKQSNNAILCRVVPVWVLKWMELSLFWKNKFLSKYKVKSLDPTGQCFCWESFLSVIPCSQAGLDLDSAQLAILIHATVTSRLEYCSMLYVRLPLKRDQKFQLDKIWCGASVKISHSADITPVLSQLYWLLFCFGPNSHCWSLPSMLFMGYGTQNYQTTSLVILLCSYILHKYNFFFLCWFL